MPASATAIAAIADEHVFIASTVDREHGGIWYKTKVGGDPAQLLALGPTGHFLAPPRAVQRA
jgi:hypothetical protein